MLRDFMSHSRLPNNVMTKTPQSTETIASVGQMPPGLIINADDLGIHPNINAGIHSAYENGLLSSCTMLLTTPYLEQTVREFVRPAVLPIGIHLSLTLGKAAAPTSKVRNLVDEQGNLKLSAAWLLWSRIDKVDALATQIRNELEAQLALAHDHGLRATHVDTHQHVHINPLIFGILEELLPRFGIDRIRFCLEPFPLFVFGTDSSTLFKRFNLAKWGLLRLRSMQNRSRLISNDRFFGVLYSGIMTKKALMGAIACASPTQCTEICLHPGFPVPAGTSIYPRLGYNNFISSSARQMEHDILLDPDISEFVEKRGLVIRAFDGQPKGF